MRFMLNLAIECVLVFGMTALIRMVEGFWSVAGLVLLTVILSQVWMIGHLVVRGDITLSRLK